jgi:hypothetical protein
MSRRRRILLLALPVVLMLTPVAVWLLLAPGTAITRANADRIHPGMTLADVEAILGGPARDETTGAVAVDRPGPLVFTAPMGRMIYSWQSDEVTIGVQVDNDDRVIERTSVHVHRVWTGPLDMLYMVRRWLRL